MTDRLQAAEEQIAHLTRTVDELSAEVAGLAREVALLTRRVHILLEREANREVDVGSTIPLADQKPPHW